MCISIWFIVEIFLRNLIVSTFIERLSTFCCKESVTFFHFVVPISTQWWNQQKIQNVATFFLLKSCITTKSLTKSSTKFHNACQFSDRTNRSLFSLPLIVSKNASVYETNALMIYFVNSGRSPQNYNSLIHILNKQNSPIICVPC